MAAPVTHLPLVKLPAGPSPITPDQQYWRTFRSQQLIPSPSSHSITHVSFPPLSLNTNNPGANDYFAVTTGLRVQLYSIRTRKLLKTITRFKDIAHSGEIRRDGKVMVASDNSGLIQVFDVNSRAILKSWNEHKQPVWTAKFSPGELTTLMSCSDDKTVRLWDLPTQQSTTTFVGHADYVRSGAFMPSATSNLLVSGSYDTTVRIWDSRAPGRAVLIFKHNAPVEAVLPMPTGTTVLATADNQISVLDLVAGKPQHLIKNHQKTVTSLCLTSKGTRIASGGLDGHVKIFETANWNVVYGTKYPSPVLTLSVVSSAGQTQEDKHLVVGMQSGLLSIRTRLSGVQKVKERARQKETQALLDGTLDAHDRSVAKQKKRTRGYEARFRGREFMGEGAEVVVLGNSNSGKRKKEKSWERSLRTGKFGQALDEVMDAIQERKATNTTLLTLLTALIHRSGLRSALSARDEVTLQPILRWVTKFIVDPRYVPVAVDVSLHILDLYAAEVGMSPEVDSLVKLLHRKVKTEVERAQVALQTGGMVEFLVCEGEIGEGR